MSATRRRQGFRNEQILVLPRTLIKMYRNYPLVSMLLVTDVGYFPSATGHYVERPTGADQYILIMCTSGRGFVEVNQKVYNLKRNSVIIIPKGAAHKYFSSGTEPWDIYWVHFVGKQVAAYPFSQMKPLYFKKSLSQIKADKIRQYIWLMISSLGEGFAIENVAYLSGVLGLLLAEVSFRVNQSLNQEKRFNRYFSGAITFMYDHLNQNLNLEEICQQLNISRSYLDKIFQENADYSPLQYFTHLRMNQAAWYLQYTDERISYIASYFGYEDMYYFSRVFKKVLGKAPTNYRRQIH